MTEGHEQRDKGAQLLYFDFVASFSPSLTCLASSLFTVASVLGTGRENFNKKRCPAVHQFQSILCGKSKAPNPIGRIEIEIEIKKRNRNSSLEIAEFYVI